MLAERSFKTKNGIYSGHRELPSIVLGLSSSSRSSFGISLKFAEDVFGYKVGKCYQALITGRTYKNVPCCKRSEKDGIAYSANHQALST